MFFVSLSEIGVYLLYNAAQRNESAISKYIPGASQAPLVVQDPPANAGTREMQLWPLGQEEAWRGARPPTQCSSWRIPRTEEPGGLQSMGSQGVGQVTERLNAHTPPVPPGRPAHPPSHPAKSSRSPELSALCNTAGSHLLSMWHTATQIHQSQSPRSSHPSLTCPLPACLFSVGLPNPVLQIDSPVPFS